MDKQLIAYKFSKSLISYNNEAIAQKQIINRLFYLLEQNFKSVPQTILEFGSGTGLLTQKILNKYHLKRLFTNDLSKVFATFLFNQFSEKERNIVEFIDGDIENVKIPENLELIISSSTEQWVERKSEFYKKIHNALTDKGFFIFSTFGPDNLSQIRKATGKSLKYYSIKEQELLLSKYFEIIYSEEDKISLSFNSAYEIVSHLKKTGVNALVKENWTKKRLKSLMLDIEKYTKTNMGFTITYHPMYFVLKKK